MKNKRNKIILIVCCICVCAGGGFLIKYMKSSPETESERINYIVGSYAIDVENRNEVVGDSDYVFVGEVLQAGKTTYASKPRKDEQGRTNAGMPYTEYKIRVIENIKNRLVTDRPILITKMGGMRYDKSGYEVFEGDQLPQTKKSYIFTARTQEDGTLLVSAPNSNVPIDNSSVKTKSRLKTNATYQKYVKACKNQVLNEKDDLSCKYNDTNTKN